MRQWIDLVLCEGFNTQDTQFERCQLGDKLTFSDGECGYGVYAYPVRYSAKMRKFYDEGGKRSIFRLTLLTGYVVDLTDPRIMPSLLAYARDQFARMKNQMTHYIMPKVSANSIQRFGAIVEDFVRKYHADAAGYTIGHEFQGSDLPKAKQTVITKLDQFKVELVSAGVEEVLGESFYNDPTDQQELQNDVRSYMRGQGASWHPHASLDAEDFIWRYETDYPIANLNPEVDKIEWMKEEIQMWADTEGQPNRYDDEIEGPIREPIFVIEVEGGVGEIIDGWHRTCGSALAGRTTIPAVVGVLKKA